VSRVAVPRSERAADAHAAHDSIGPKHSASFVNSQHRRLVWRASNCNTSAFLDVSLAELLFFTKFPQPFADNPARLFQIVESQARDHGSMILCLTAKRTNSAKQCKSNFFISRARYTSPVRTLIPNVAAASLLLFPFAKSRKIAFSLGDNL